MPPLSILDLSPIAQGANAGQALRNSLDLAQHGEKWGYKRYWLAEHHSMPGIASAATAVAIGFVAQGTSSIRLGSGGIMLPNHAPLVIAEQFGTLESLYPGRIDLGLGRAPGTDPLTARALRRGNANSAESFPQDVQELQRYFQGSQPAPAVRAVPGAGLEVPLYLLGSSLFSAQLAAALGVPFAFASHFAPDDLEIALDIYRSRFTASAALAAPYAIVTVGACAAQTDDEAHRLFTSQQQSFVNLRRGSPGPLPAPVASMDGLWGPLEKANSERAFREALIGSLPTIREKLSNLLDRTQADEVMLSGSLYEHAARLRSFELLSELIEAPVASHA